jgi:16S rRNA processing protein RimM
LTEDFNTFFQPKAYEPMAQVTEYYLIAKIISASGNEGFVNITLFTDFPEHLYSLKKVYIDFFNDKKEFIVDKVKNAKDKYQIKLKNFESAKDSELLIGKEIFIIERDLLKLQKDQYYIHDLIGSIVLRNNVEIGKITDVISLPANDVYIVQDKNKNEILIPAISVYVESFDPEKKIMLLKPGEDLYDADED